ncbi:ATP-binding protein [Legionella steigerwaltii]|uniref:ATP-binding protein n=1 Tax=Legionella steigerwaltii TaxID=460 RepID=UPI001EE7751E|nr:ATP-binding protein [Legionella steigerwaltii]
MHFRDNGPGIIPEHQDKIFHSYFTTKAQGSGLGLTICRDLIELHGGKLYIPGLFLLYQSSRIH